jgi:hypothetical protein
MTKEELLATLQDIDENWDMESGHKAADKALINFINDPEIKEAYEKIGKWYA